MFIYITTGSSFNFI